jgi:hypothetical protein
MANFSLKSDLRHIGTGDLVNGEVIDSSKKNEA